MHFDTYYEQWSRQIGALCFLLCGHRRDSADVAFQSFLRLGGAKDPEIAEKEARMLLFHSAVRLCDDYYLKKMRRRPTAKRLAAQDLPFPVSEALVSLMHLSFRRKAALALQQFGFSHDELAEILNVRPSTAAKLADNPKIDGWQDVLRAIEMTEDELLIMSDRIYTRFAERSVGVENAIHDARNAFDRATPYLALAVLALFAIAIWYVRTV